MYVMNLMMLQTTLKSYTDRMELCMLRTLAWDDAKDPASVTNSLKNDSYRFFLWSLNNQCKQETVNDIKKT